MTMLTPLHGLHMFAALHYRAVLPLMPLVDDTAAVASVSSDLGDQERYRRVLEDTPPRFRQWVEGIAGPSPCLVASIHGFTPGCVGRLETSVGHDFFLKAVSRNEHNETGRRIAMETLVLTSIAGAPAVPTVVATYDDGDWVGFVEEFVVGEHPNLQLESDYQLVLSALDILSPTLTAARGLTGVRTMRTQLDRWHRAWRTVSAPSAGILPDWLLDFGFALEGQFELLMDLAVPETLCHWDLTPENLIRSGSDLLVLDWARTRIGPRWADPYFLLLNCVDQPLFDVRAAALPALRNLSEDNLTALLLLHTASMGWHAQQEQAALPSLPEHRRRRFDKMLTGLQRRLGLEGSSACSRDQ